MAYSIKIIISIYSLTLSHLLPSSIITLSTYLVSTHIVFIKSFIIQVSTILHSIIYAHDPLLLKYEFKSPKGSFAIFYTFIISLLVIDSKHYHPPFFIRYWVFLGYFGKRYFASATTL